MLALFPGGYLGIALAVAVVVSAGLIAGAVMAERLMWPFVSHDKRRRIRAGRADWERFTDTARSGDPNAVRGALARLQQSSHGMELADEERGRLARRAFRAYAEAVLLDGAIDQDEDIVWSELWQALGLERSTELTDLARRLLIVRAANGCPEILSDHKLFTRAAESVFLEIDSGLLGRQQVEFQGHVIGSEVVVSVAGTLSVTSQRVVFIGDARSIEFEYGDIVAAEYYSNGIRFQVANAETFVFKLPDGWGEVVAAITDHARANEAAA